MTATVMVGRSVGKRRASLTLIALLVSLVVGLVLAPAASAGTDDYPSQWRNAPQDSKVDNWGELSRECTSFVAWRLSSQNGFTMPFHDNASGWGADAASRGYAVNMTPAVGSVAWWSSGHVAWVEAVNGASVTIEEYNYGLTGAYSERVIAAGSVSGYIHFRDLAIGSSSQLFIRGDSAVFAMSGIGGGGWTQETGSGNAVAIAAGGNTQLFLRGDGAIFASSTISNGGWVQETDPNMAGAIAVSSTGIQMFIGKDASIWAKRGIGYGGWTQELGSGNANAIAVGGNTQMFIRGDAAVFATDTIGGPWTQETSSGNANKVAVSSTGVQMFIRGDSAVFATNSVGGAWTQETGPGNATAIAVGGNTQMFIRGDSAVFATTSIGGSWMQETDPGNAIAIAAGGDGTQMFIRGDASIFARLGVGSGGWTQEVGPGNANTIAAG